MALAQAIRARRFDTITCRPTLSKWQKGRLVAKVAGAMSARAFAGAVGAIFGGQKPGSGERAA
jgi:starvation-inducible outer membrane lipoprotein